MQIEIDAKHTECNWDERIRASSGQSGPHPEGSEAWKWGTFKQTNIDEKGLMDRYANIKPWNHNRVRLRVPPGQLDYVNASAIELASPSDRSRPPLRYIAMQGPTPPSIPYVWRMIAEQVKSPVVIVQLTNYVENGHIKCDQYFPDGQEGESWDLNEDDVWEDGWRATLTFEAMEYVGNGTIEKSRLRLDVEGEDQPIIVWHFLYTKWPDFGVPGLDDLDSFFELMRLSREHSSPDGPRIVHCSAGVGRTGTFISLEHLIRELDVSGLCDPTTNGNGKPKPYDAYDPVFITVDKLRQQRRGMVQGDPQYRFIYQVMRKLWEDRHKDLAADDDDDDEDMAEGGASIQRQDDAASKSDMGSDPFYEQDNNDDDDDDDDGGAQVK
jgi:protein-tyrosine phosphatase